MQIYMLMNTYIYGTFEKESQWGGARFPADIYTPYIYMYIYCTYPRYLQTRNSTYRIRWDGLFGLPRPCSYIYLRKTSKVNVPVLLPCIFSLDTRAIIYIICAIFIFSLIFSKTFHHFTISTIFL